MRSIPSGFRLAAWLLALAAPPAALAGVTVTVETPSERRTMYLEGNRFRVDTADREGNLSVVIFEGDQKRFLIADGKARRYFVMTEADLRKAGMRVERENAARAEGKAPAEGTRRPALPKVAYSPTGEKRTVAGFRCEVYQEKVEGRLEGEGCFIPWSSRAVTRADLAPLEKLLELRRSMAAGPEDRPLKEEKLLAGAPGFAAWHVDIADGKRGEEELLKSLARGAIPAATFGPPPGFTRVEVEF